MKEYNRKALILSGCVCAIIFSCCKGSKTNDPGPDSCVVEIVGIDDSDSTVGTSSVRTESLAKVDDAPIYEEPDVKKALPGSVPFNFTRDHFLGDGSYSLHYDINLALPPKAPLWIKKFINGFIHTELSDIFFEDSASPTLCNMEKGSWPEMAAHYFKWLKKNYIKEYPQSDEETKYIGRDYEFRMKAYPVWENDDYITYQMYVSELPGSMRNRELDFCLTFDKASGRVLGINDFYTASEFKEVAAWLAQELDSRIGAKGLEADVDPEICGADNEVLKEKYNGKLYPRPAMTSEGVIFTYQTYEKSHGADGILKFYRSLRAMAAQASASARAW